MRRAVPAAAAVPLLAGPTVLAFFSGGYFAEPRLLAGIVAWALVLVLCIAGPAPLPRALPGRLALAGLAGLTCLSALSIAWAPQSGPALDSVERLVLYTGALMLAIGVLRDPRALRAMEPALAAGATVVIAYGLAGRLLPGLIELARSESAGGRLEQPLTYWNAEGTLAALGFVLCARLSGDRSRSAVMRAAAAAAAAPLGSGIYLTFSRGAIAVAVVGLLVLVAAAPSRAQLSAAAIALGAGVAAAACCAVLPGVAGLDGTLPDRERDGLIAFAALAVVAALAAALTVRRRDDERPLERARWFTPLAVAAVAAVAAGLVFGGLSERPGGEALSAGAEPSRLTAVSSNRYEYWRVGLEAFARDPLVGAGSGSFRVAWLRERSINEAVRDAHSLEVEVAAELGLAGLVALALLVGGVALAAREALARHPALAAGPAAAALTWFLHASIDWDWQMPAVTLPAIVLAGSLVALAEAQPGEAVSAAARSADRAGTAPLAPAPRSPGRAPA